MIKGKPLPPVEEIAPPSQEELDKVNAEWDANCPSFYRGLLDAQSINTSNPAARFLYDRARMKYIHRASGRVLTEKDLRDAYVAYNRKITGR